MFENKKIGVIVPAYNEEERIENAINNIPDYVDKILVIDDGSTDNTYKISSFLAKSNDKISVISHDGNRGVGAAIITGYKKCLQNNIDIVAIMAGDGDMDPEFLSIILKPIVEDKADYVKAERVSRPEFTRGMSNWRRLGNWLLRWLTRIASGNYKILDPQAGYTAISSKTLKQLNLDGIFTYYGYCNDLLVKLSVKKARILEIPAPYMFRKGPVTSKIRYWHYIPKVSGLLLRDFFWRLKVQYFKSGN